jgi:hypothetical protein
MINHQNIQLKNADTVKSGRPALTGDLLVYLTLIGLTLGVWYTSQQNYFEAGDDVGYWIGVVGASMMVVLFLYPMRKHFKFAKNWGKLKWWFVIHMFLGVGGPLLILLHSTFRVGSLNAAVALYSMIIVALSGVIGRFIFARVNRGLRDEQMSFQELQVHAGLDKEVARSNLAPYPDVEARLKGFEQSELHAKGNWINYLRQVFWLPIKMWVVYYRCISDVRKPMLKLAHDQRWSNQDLIRRQKRTNKLVRRYLIAVVRVAQYTAYARLFSLWHVAHIPFVYLLVISAVVHVFAVHAY